MEKSKPQRQPRRNIPDLRDHVDQITLDHCYVLIERLGEVFATIEGEPNFFHELANEFQPEMVQDYLQQFFKAPEFSRLYKTEMGKGVLVGVFAGALLIQMKGQLHEED